MFEVTRSSFSVFLMIIFWLLLIASVSCGIYYGATIGHILLFGDDNENFVWSVLLFGFAGLLIGFIIFIVFFGSTVTLLNIDENLEKIKLNIDVNSEKIKKEITDLSETIKRSSK